jgi:hypothetical protein
MKEYKWPYVAGLMDGEGSICIYRSRDHRLKNGQFAYGMHVQIVSTNIDVIKWILGNFGGRFYERSCEYKHNGFKANKTIYHWALTGSANRERFLLGVLPYLIIKREQALVGLEFIRLGSERNPQKRQELCDKCKELNGRKDRYISKWNSPETNTLSDSNNESMIESGLDSDIESAPAVTQEGKEFPYKEYAEAISLLA